MSLTTPAAAMAVLLSAATVFAQCTTQWLPGLPTPSVALGAQPGLIRCMTAYDPDGEGPMPERLLVGGQFDNMEGTPARGIAEWDGTQWSAPIAGTALLSLDATCAYNGQIVVGGSFNIGTGLTNIMRWDGAAWQPFGAGLFGRVRALTVYNGMLYAGGDFANAGGDPLADGIALWDGTQWRSLGAGLSCTGCAAAFPVRALLPTPQGLYVGGDFSTAGGADSQDVAMWDGASWHALPGLGAPATRVNALTMHQGVLYAGGISFGTGNSIARLNPDTQTWTILPSQGSGEMLSLASYGPNLYAAGNMQQMFNPSMSLPTRLVRWDGAALTAVTDTVNPLFVAPSQGVLTSAVYQGRLLLAGQSTGYRFTLGAETIRACILSFDGTSWGTLAKGLDAAALDIERIGPDLVFAGGFRVAGGKRVNGVARWDGNEFQPMGTGLLSTLSSTTNELVADLHVGPDGVLYAAGMFNQSDTIPDAVIGGIGKWDGTRWRRVSPSNPSGQMYDMATFGNELFLCGNGFVSGSTGVVRFNGSAWSGTGASAGFLCVEPFEGTLYAGSSRWNGTAFSLVPGASTQMVKLRTIGQRFYGLTDGVFPRGVTSIGELRDGAWSPVGTGVVSSISQSISGSLNAFHGELIAARAFVLSGQTPNTARVVRWTGTGWRPIAGDPDALPPLESPAAPARASTTCVDGDTLWVSGVFLNAGGRPSPYLARYMASAGPSLTLEPEDTATCTGRSVTLVVNASPGVEYRWRRNESPLIDTQELPTGTRVSGAMTPTLTILVPVSGDSGTYDCVVTTACGSATSRGAAVVVTPLCCTPDFTGDGNLDQDDVACLIAVIAGDGDCSSLNPDFNEHGNVNQDDVAALVHVIAGGACP